MNEIQARCRPGQKTGCVSVEEFFRVMMILYTLAAMAQRQGRA